MVEHMSTAPLNAEAFSEDDIWGPAKAYNRNGIELGTVGWDDTDIYFEQGTEADDGHTLVRVQLYRGRGLTKMGDSVDPKIGHGRKLLCHISSGIFRIPPKGTRVYVALPAGYEDVPGAGCIIATVEKNPFLQYNDDRVHFNFGEDKHVVIRGKSVTITDPSNRFIMVGTSRGGGPGMLLAQDETGSGWTVQNGTVGLASASSGSMVSLMQISPTEISLIQTDGAGVITQLKSGEWKTVCSNFYAIGGGVYLGMAANPASTALYGATGIAGVASTKVFISP